LKKTAIVNSTIFRSTIGMRICGFNLPMTS
jgi:hypothetical protein